LKGKEILEELGKKAKTKEVKNTSNEERRIKRGIEKAGSSKRRESENRGSFVEGKEKAKLEEKAKGKQGSQAKNRKRGSVCLYSL
jgi:hypothetical protein